MSFFYFFFIFNSCTQADEEKYFVCDILPDDFKKEVDPNRPFDGVLSYSDRTFYYKKTNSGHYEAYFPLYGGTALGIKLNGDILSNAYLRFSREQQGFHREKFDVYQIDIKTRVLTHSYVYYVSLEDYNKNFNNSDFVPYNQPLLFDLINRKAPENYVKIGWDKTKWQCYEISYFRYLLFMLKNILFLFTA